MSDVKYIYPSSSDVETFMIHFYKPSLMYKDLTYEQTNMLMEHKNTFYIHENNPLSMEIQLMLHMSKVEKLKSLIIKSYTNNHYGKSVILVDNHQLRQEHENYIKKQKAVIIKEKLEQIPHSDAANITNLIMQY